MYRLAFILGLLALVATGIPARPAAARELCFPDKPDIPACFGDPFSGYWEANGGLPVFGYPLSRAQQERNPDLRVDLRTQWTERNRLELHPENKPPFDILLGRMGAERLRQSGRDPAQEGREAGPRPGCLWFETTGLNVCDQAPGRGFKSYWQSRGLKIPNLDAYGRSLQLFGYPLTTPRLETNPNGDLVLTQWFERARFEWHPSNPDPYKVLLGLLGKELRTNAPATRPPSVFGVEIHPGAVEPTAGKAQAAGTSWMRYNGILWSDVEARQGVRDWARLARVDNELRASAAHGLTPVVVVRGTPSWAQKVAGWSCGPVKADALDDFASFMRELVARYSAPPFNVRYWEIGNEPDVDPRLVLQDSQYGCWGDESDAYYGGGYYAEMLKQVYPAVKQANPSAQVVLGGLLLDCDPTRPPAGKDCKPARFLEGILRAGGGAYLDIVAYHSYSIIQTGAVDSNLTNPGWSHRGGSLIGKLDFLQSILNQYGVHKPILMNEGGANCYTGTPNCPGEETLAVQANYGLRLYIRTWAHGLLGAVWYTMNGPGWREGALLDAAQAPRPAYQTVAFLSTLLKDAVYAGRLSQGTIEGYAFRRGGQTFQVYWSNDSTTRTIPLPAGTRTIYDKLGRGSAPQGSSLTISFEPVLIEIGP